MPLAGTGFHLPAGLFFRLEGAAGTAPVVMPRDARGANAAVNGLFLQ